MGAGKSTVGPILARRMGWDFLDLDTEIAAAAALSVPAIFARLGEPAFRRLEADVTRQAMPREEVVFATGGGWMANPEAVAALPTGSVTVWLQASAGEVMRRVGRDAANRPLLAGPDPAAAVRRLMREREPLYRRATFTVETDGRAAPEIAAEIEILLRSRGSAAPSS